MSPRSTTSLPSGQRPELRPLNPLVGEWMTEATRPTYRGTVVTGRAGFQWLQGEQFLIQRSQADHLDVPDACEALSGYWNRQTASPVTDALNSAPRYVASRTLREPLPWPNSSLPEGDAADADAELKDHLPRSLRGPQGHQLRGEA
jgi:hypothetical protein